MDLATQSYFMPAAPAAKAIIRKTTGRTGILESVDIGTDVFKEAAAEVGIGISERDGAIYVSHGGREMVDGIRGQLKLKSRWQLDGRRITGKWDRVDAGVLMSGSFPLVAPVKRIVEMQGWSESGTADLEDDLVFLPILGWIQIGTASRNDTGIVTAIVMTRGEAEKAWHEFTTLANPYTAECASDSRTPGRSHARADRLPET